MRCGGGGAEAGARELPSGGGGRGLVVPPGMFGDGVILALVDVFARPPRLGVSYTLRLANTAWCRSRSMASAISSIFGEGV